MKKEIDVIYDLPVIFTKHLDFAEKMEKNEKWRGRIVLLPEDAVLYVPPTIMSVEITPNE